MCVYGEKKKGGGGVKFVWLKGSLTVNLALTKGKDI